MRERKRNRLLFYDYSRDNLYFVTSCVQDRVCCFGRVSHGNMILNEYGKIAHDQWHWLGQQYPYVVLHAFVVMPDHVHGIIEIKRGDCCDSAAAAAVGEGRDLPLRRRRRRNHNNPKIKSLSELMGAYKTTSSKKIHLSGYPEFSWQRSFYDHIIRNHEAYRNISNYIIRNPSNWKEK